MTYISIRARTHTHTHLICGHAFREEVGADDSLGVDDRRPEDEDGAVETSVKEIVCMYVCVCVCGRATRVRAFTHWWADGA